MSAERAVSRAGTIDRGADKNVSPHVGNIKLGLGAFGGGTEPFLLGVVLEVDAVPGTTPDTLFLMLATALSLLIVSEFVRGVAGCSEAGAGLRFFGDGDVSGVCVCVCVPGALPFGDRNEEVDGVFKLMDEGRPLTGAEVTEMSSGTSMTSITSSLASSIAFRPNPLPSEKKLAQLVEF